MFLQNAIADALATGAVLVNARYAKNVPGRNAMPALPDDQRHMQRVLSNLQRRTKTTGYVLAPIPETTGIS